MGETRVVIADVDANTRKSVRAILSQAGHLVVGEAEDGTTAIKLIRTRQPDIVILEARMAAMDGTELADIIEEDGLAPVILMTSGDKYRINDQVLESGNFAHLSKPVSEGSLLPMIDVIMNNYKRIRSLELEVAKLRDTIETRKLVEKAKGILMDSLGIPEAEAFKRIQKQSMNKRVSMKSVAKAIILADEINK